jgi:hypothetical protein
MTVTDLCSLYDKIKIYKTVTLPVVFVSVKLDQQPKEEYNLWLLKKTALRGIFRPLKKEVTGRVEKIAK